MPHRKPPGRPSAGRGNDRGQPFRPAGAGRPNRGRPERSPAPERRDGTDQGGPRAAQHDAKPARDEGQRGRRHESADERVRLYGVHAVAAALANPRRTINRVKLTTANLERFAEACAARGLEPQKVEGAELDHILGKAAVHQGVMVEADVLDVPDITELDPEQLPSGRRALVVVLDQVTDPHNVGAILRSAAAFGADALVMTARNSPPLDGVLAKAASGGLEAVTVVTVGNLSRALEKLGELGYFRIGLEGTGTSDIADEAADSPTVLVLGAESSGMRRLTAEHCDRICRIGTSGEIGSLNVSNAAAIALHTLRLRQR